jgi:hypothetical protein
MISGQGGRDPGSPQNAGSPTIARRLPTGAFGEWREPIRGLRRMSGQWANEMDVVWLFGEQRRVGGFGETATLSEVEADRGSSRGRGDVKRSRSGLAREPGCGAPQLPRRSMSPVRSAHVEEREPAEPRFERRMDDRQSHQHIAVKRAEKDRSTGQEISAVRDASGHAVFAESFPIPWRDLGHRNGSLLEPSVDHRVFHVNVLRPIQLGDHRDVVRYEPLHRWHTREFRASAQRDGRPNRRAGATAYQGSHT